MLMTLCDKTNDGNLALPQCAAYSCISRNCDNCRTKLMDQHLKEVNENLVLSQKVKWQWWGYKQINSDSSSTKKSKSYCLIDEEGSVAELIKYYL